MRKPRAVKGPATLPKLGLVLAKKVAYAQAIRCNVLNAPLS